MKIGNSRGIRIPKKVLDQCRVEGTLELTIQNDEIVLTPVHKKPREGWIEAFEATASESMGQFFESMGQIYGPALYFVCGNLLKD